MAAVLWAPKSHLPERTAHIKQCQDCQRKWFQVPEVYLCPHCKGITWPVGELRDMRVFCDPHGEPCLDMYYEGDTMTKRCLTCQQPITNDRQFCQRHEPTENTPEDDNGLLQTVLALETAEVLDGLPAPDPVMDTPVSDPDFGGFGGGDSGGAGAGGDW
jgi:hypothetical protein